MPIADVQSLERLRQRVLVVLRVGARARHGAHIGHELDLGAQKELGEDGEGPGRVPDRVERAHVLLCRAAHATIEASYWFEGISRIEQGVADW